MSIVNILISFVSGGAIGGGALYALQQGKIREALHKYEKIRKALGETEAELKDSKGQLKLLDLSEERIRNIEATYREEVAKLQKELEDSQGRLPEMASANHTQAVGFADKTQIEELQREQEAKIEELRQSYQSQIQEIIDGKQGEMEVLRQSHQAQILELEKSHQLQIQQLEQGYQSQLLELQNARQTGVDDRTAEILEPWDDFPDSPSAEETLGLEPEFAPETLLETPVFEPEFTSETNPFDGFITEEILGLEPEFASETLLEMPVFEETSEGLSSGEEALFSPEMTEIEDFSSIAESEISDWEMSAAEMEFLNSLTLEEERRMIGSLEELSVNYEQIQETVSTDPSFPDLLTTDAEKFTDNQNVIDDLFVNTADINSLELFDPFAEETPTFASKSQNIASVASGQEELDFFSMLDDEDIGNIESLPSDEELPLGDLFRDD